MHKSIMNMKLVSVLLSSTLLAILVRGEESTQYWSVELISSVQDFTAAKAVASKHGMQLLGQIGNLKGHYHFKRWKNSSSIVNDVELKELLLQELLIGSVEEERGAMMSVRNHHPTDPLWPQQWPLQRGGLNVESVWNEGVTGGGVVVTIVDDGLETTHSELYRHYDSLASYDYVNYDHDPNPEGRYHGNACAGIVAMARDNGVCGVGVAYECNIGGVRIDLGSVSDASAASALGHANDHVDVYSCSWGPPDTGYWWSRPGPLTLSTLLHAVQNGRGGRGSVYVWAAGNGGEYFDSCAADGFVSSVYTIATGSVNRDGSMTAYEELCAGKMVVAFSHSAQPMDSQVVSVKNGDECTDNFSGTSSASPLTAAVIALTLQVNPALTWRDVQHLLVATANRTALRGGDWVINGGGINVSHVFGFGAVDARAMVTGARTWINVPRQLTQTVYSSTISGRSELSAPLSLTLNVGASAIHYLEHVVLQLSVELRDMGAVRYSASDVPQSLNSSTQLHAWFTNHSTHPSRGDILIDLISPSGTVSHLLPYRRYDFVNNEGFTNWPFMSVQHWGEDPTGPWNLTLSFNATTGFVSVSNIKLKLYGIDLSPHTPSPFTLDTPSPSTLDTFSPSMLDTSSPSMPDASSPIILHTPSPSTQPTHIVAYMFTGLTVCILLVVVVCLSVGVVTYCCIRKKAGFKQLQNNSII